MKVLYKHKVNNPKLTLNIQVVQNAYTKYLLNAFIQYNNFSFYFRS